MKQRTVLIEIEIYTSAKVKDLKTRAQEFGIPSEGDKVEQVQVNVIQQTKK